VAEPATLSDHAEAFAQELTDTFAGVFGPDTPSFVAETSPKPQGSSTRVLVHPENSADICLTIAGAQALTLLCDYHCVFDSQSRYLKVRKANIHVRPVSEATPLFRYEFEDAMSPALPCAHLQIHAHRDEFLYTMLRAERGKPATRASAATGASQAAVPRLANLHFPLGGPRMRPCIEDVLQMLVSEFCVETEPSAQQVLDAGRAVWRRRQIGALVRDAPAEAARVLRELHYDVTEPPTGPAPERIVNLTRF
jgi:hypothetical protein